MKSIVFYYSRTGKTATAAKALADKTSSELVEIKDLKNRNGIIGWIRALMDARGMKTTQIEPDNIDTADYDTICLGTPIWAGKPASAIYTVIQNFEIKGKDVILFVTLNGDKYKNMLNLMSQEVESNGGNVIKTIAIVKSGSKTDSDIINEVNKIDIAF